MDAPQAESASQQTVRCQLEPLPFSTAATAARSACCQPGEDQLRLLTLVLALPEYVREHASTEIQPVVRHLQMHVDMTFHQKNTVAKTKSKASKGERAEAA
mmetsp:Transcript_93847/g.205420  ORF Transcript_93847/g.205420 Transcript_93847/m.205420 type:complete len:101 (-) Transcript_93847:1-303(-)